MRQLVWLDLCSGLGGASQPALDRGWKVVRVDIDPRFKPDIVADARALPLRAVRVDVLWASPPCQEFSKWGLRCFFPNPPEPDATIPWAIRWSIEELKPRHWFVENAWAARPWFNRIFGPVATILPGHAIWSDTRILFPNLPPHKGSAGYRRTGRWEPMGHAKLGNLHNVQQVPLSMGISRMESDLSSETLSPLSSKPKRWGTFGTASGGQARGSGRRNAAQSAVIPYEIGETICRAVEARVSD